VKVLIREKIADAGVELLRERFDVDVDTDGDLAAKIGDYDAIVIRSATKLDADLIGRAERLKVIGRAGVGVDNVDVEAATCSLCRGTSRRHTRRSRKAGGSARGTEASSSPGRRWECSGLGGSDSRSRAARSVSRCASSPTTRSWRRSGSGSSESIGPRRRTRCSRQRTSSRCICR
jgi:hypothetical protein